MYYVFEMRAVMGRASATIDCSLELISSTLFFDLRGFDPEATMAALAAADLFPFV